MSAEQPTDTAQAMQLALQRYEAGDLANAESACRRVLAVEPANTDAFNLLGAIAIHARKFELAAELFAQAIRYQPTTPGPHEATAHYGLANALHALGRLTEAERGYRQALALRAAYPQAHNNLGLVLQELERSAEAEIHFREAIALRPDYAGAHNNLGTALQEMGRLQEAEQCYCQALAIDPRLAIAHNNLGNALAELGNFRDAERSYRQTLAFEPDRAETHSNLGSVLEKLGRFDEAEASLRRALALKPDYPAAFSNLGTLLKVLGRVEEAESSYRRALELQADDIGALSQWLHQSQHLCAWAELKPRAEILRAEVAKRRAAKVSPFAFLSLPGTSAAEQRECARQYAEATYAHFLSRPVLYAARASNGGKRRIGYLSADYREHATSYLLVEIIERHDHSRFQAFGYSLGPDDASPMRRRIAQAFDEFRDLRDMSHELAARRIIDDGIDILVDLKGYTVNNRMPIAALRPAPVQVNWLGYPGTFGVARMADYLIGDPVVTPVEDAAHYSEALALMPHCYQPNDRSRPIGPKPTRLEAGLPEKGFVFCSFNQSLKIGPVMFDLWCRLLTKVPDSVLWLLQAPSAAQANLRREAEARGVDGGRILFAPFQPLARHLGRLQLADLALDTFPYTSHTTASDALWAGVPLVTLKGETFVSRVAASILSAASLPELATQNLHAYYQLAFELATQRERLAGIKDALAVNRMTCPLFDSERFTRDLERLYERIWSNAQAGKREHIIL